MKLKVGPSINILNNMGCGCKGKKKTNSETAIENRRILVEEQKDYQGKVRNALKQLMELRQRKQRIPRK